MAARLLFTSLLFLFTLIATAQQKPFVDSTHNDSIRLAEQILIQQQQQQKIDSMMMLKFQKEIQLLTNGSKEKQELEKQLKELTVKDSLRHIEQRNKIDQLRKTAKGYPVVLLTDTLFYIYTRSGSFNAQVRAAAVTERISKLYNDNFFKPDSLQLLQSENGYDVNYKQDLTLISISNIDALYFNKTPHDLANEYLQKIRKVIVDFKKKNSFVNWITRIGLALLVVVGILLIIYVINRFFKFILKRLIRQKDNYFKGFSVKNFTLIKPKQHLQFVLRFLKIVRLATILLMLYLSLPVMFSIFPQTEAYTYTLINWVISPAKAVIKGVVSYLPNLFTIIVIFLFTRYAIKGIKYISDEVEAGNLAIKGFYSDWSRPTYNIIRFLLYAFMLVVIFPYLPGSGSPAFQGISVFLGILFSFGSSSSISNIVAGLVITYMRSFKVGDRVKIGDITGDVLEKTMLVTRLRTIKNEEITVPNATVLSGHTVNYTAGAEHAGLILNTTVTIGYDVPWKKMHAALIDAALRTEHVLHDPKPFVLQTGLEDFYVSYQINAYTKNPSAQARIYSDLHQNIQDSCNEAGIEIMSPHYKAVRDGNMTTIPEDYLSPNYKTPGFNINTISAKKED